MAKVGRGHQNKEEAVEEERKTKNVKEQTRQETFGQSCIQPRTLELSQSRTLTLSSAKVLDQAPRRLWPNSAPPPPVGIDPAP